MSNSLPAGLLKPRKDTTLTQRMVELGNDSGLAIRRAAGDTTITDELIAQAKENRQLLLDAGLGYIEARRGF